MEILDNERDDIATYDRLKEFAIRNINDDTLFVAVHILEAIYNDTGEWYEYDYCMGTCQTPSSIHYKDDVEHLFDFDDEE